MNNNTMDKGSPSVLDVLESSADEGTPLNPMQASQVNESHNQ